MGNYRGYFINGIYITWPSTRQDDPLSYEIAFNALFPYPAEHINC